MSPGDRSVIGKIDLTQQAQRVFELSQEEAELAHSFSVMAEHILIGIIREGAAGVLEEMGVSLDRVRAQIAHELSQRPS